MALTSVNAAITAYNNVARSVTGGAVEEAPGSGGGDFASLLKSGVESALRTGQKAEELSKQAIAGKADVRDVVAAVNNAELTLQTVVSVRDKVITAYSEILKMPI
jgi:flagellar hook-basal body complex protein FliE